MEVIETAYTFVYLRDRTVRHLETLPLLAAAMAANARPVDPVRSSAKPGPRMPAELSGLDLLDEVWALLGNWATNIADRLGETPHGALVYHAAVGRDLTGFPSSLSRDFRVSLVSQVAGWLKTRQSAIRSLPFAREWDSDLDSNMRAWLNRYPIEIEEQADPRPCPNCGRSKVVVTWSEDPEGYDDYRADCEACGFVVAAVGTMIPNHQDGDES